jgi:GntR family transcriptional repressor for pyruvate dehydrogenase complex
MSAQFAPIVTASLARQIAESLRQSILDGTVKADERLPAEEELAERFSVSRPTVREALKRLAAEHLIQSRRGPSGGNFVKQPSVEEIGGTLANALRVLVSLDEFKFEDIAEARRELESTCCRLAAERGTSVDFAAMRDEIAKQRDPALTDAEFCASDVRFHQALAAAAHNSVIRFMVLAMNEALQPVTNFLVFRFRERKIVAEQHERILKALESRNADDAIGALSDQIAYIAGKFAEARQWRKTNGR